MDIAKDFAQVRSWIVLNPRTRFFAGILLRLELEVSTKLPTAWTNGKVIGINPEYYGKQTPDQRKALILHEIMHNALLHPFRAHGKEHGLFNMAADYAINYLIRQMELPLYSGALEEPRFAGQGVEEIYWRLYREAQEQDKKPDMEDEEDSASTQDDEENTGQNAGQNDDKETDNGTPQDSDEEAEAGPGQDDDEPGENQGEGESQGEGEAGPGEIAPEDHGQVLPYPGDPADEGQEMVAVEQAMRLAKAKGTLPASVEDAIRTSMQPELDWRAELARYLLATSRDDYSYTRPNRRYSSLDGGVIIPSLYSQRVDGIMLAVDTSGSMGQEEIDMVWGEITGVLDQMADDWAVTCLWYDTEVYPQHLTPGDKPIVQGRGGTRFACVPEWITDNVHTLDADPKLLINLTDGYDYEFGDEPDCEVLWVLTYPNSYFKPPYGSTICIRS